MLGGFVVLAAIFMFGVYWPLRTSMWPSAMAICAIGASTVFKESARIIWSPWPLPFDPLIPQALQIGTARLSMQFLITIAVSFVIIPAVFIFFEKLYAGRVMQAAAQDKYVGELMGIPTTLTTLCTYIIVTAISGIGGYLIAPAFYVSTSLANLQARAFAGVVIGGWGNIKGSVMGSLIVGLIEAFSINITTTYRDAIVFTILIFVLMVRPEGFFSSRISDKA